MVGGCWPLLAHNYLFPILYNAVGTVVPILIISSVNMKIVEIAKHHRFRIASALFGITPFGAEIKLRQKEVLR